MAPYDGAWDSQHVRRFVKDADLTPAARALLELAGLTTGTTRISVPARVELHTNVSTFPVHGENADASTGRAARRPAEMLVILAPCSAILRETLHDALAQLDVHVAAALRTVNVPKLAPTSAEQARVWSEKLWPTVYKRHNPFGPHASLVERAQAEVQREISRWMALAFQVARERRNGADFDHGASGDSKQGGMESGRGLESGVVIVQRNKDGLGHVIAAAGDARWIGWCHGGTGNVFGHAAMRAIGMIGEGLRRRNEQRTEGTGDSPASDSEGTTDTLFLHRPINCIEEQHTTMLGDATGYLCLDLEVYCTHEPCVMCSMAIVHSRFARIVFRYPMPRTGGIMAEGGLNHGLWWRKELNWSMLAWQCIPDSEREKDAEEDAASWSTSDIHV